jgi:hypothetical protein
MPFRLADILACQANVSSTDDFEDLRIREVRSEQAGVTRYPPVDPLIAFTSARSTLCSLGSCRHEPPLMGFNTINGRTNRPSMCLLSRVSKNRRVDPFP